MIEKGIAISHETGIFNWLVELYRIKGEILRTVGEEADAEVYFLKAVETARQQQARSWELRAATSLARLWQAQGKQRQAFDTLNTIYGWFTEGFETHDLRLARALLDQLEGSQSKKGAAR